MTVVDIQVWAQVDRMFSQMAFRGGETVQNPVTKSPWIKGEDAEEPQRLAAYRALLARQWFAGVAPEDAPFLPLSYEERERLKVGGLPHMVALFARSLATLDYDFKSHPSFDEYARGVMASPNAPEFIKKDPDLRRRFSPGPLRGLGSGLIWRP
jgi:hypothetical protein